MLLDNIDFDKSPKVFCVGDNKTGTTSMEYVLKLIGYKLPIQIEQEKQITEETISGNYEPFKNFCEQYNAFQDLPFSQGLTYIIADVLFPNSKFILTVRDSNKWFDSLLRWHKIAILPITGITDESQISEETFKDIRPYLHVNYIYNVFKGYVTFVKDNEVYYDWSLLYNRDHRINLYEKRNQEIIKYFKDREDQLLVIDLSKEKDTSKILNFLNMSSICLRDMPKLNYST